MKYKIGMVTIGQSPRIDVTKEIKEILDSDIPIVECGALDNLSYEEILNLKPTKKNYILVTKLRNGRQVIIDREKIYDKVKSCIKKLEKTCDMIVLLCTGEFNKLHSEKLLILPSKLLYNVVKALSPKKIGILIPSKDQVKEVRFKWKKLGVSMIIDAYSPYRKYSEDRLMKIANRFVNEGVEIIILDCIGYSMKISSELKKITHKPVISPRTLIARILNEIL